MPMQSIFDHTFINTVEHFAELDSTNRLAMELANRGEVALPLLVSTDQQTAGRGRGANQWWSAAGALTISLVVDQHTVHCIPQHCPQLALITGLAVAETIIAETTAAETTGTETADAEIADTETLSVTLKWPNDVLLNGKKIAGILLEIPPQQRTAVVVGIGVNLNNSLNTAPPELRQTATSLIDELLLCDKKRDAIDPIKFQITLFQQLEQLWKQFSHDPAAWKNRWQSYCELTGAVVTVVDGSRTIRGLCHGVTANGQLRIQTDSDEQRLSSGHVVKIEKP